MWAARTLLITDPNLGEAAHERLAAVCEDLAWLSWDFDHPGGREAALGRIADSRWDLAISFYSDLVLSPEALAAIALPLNIHPALPAIRGVGHDVVPLIEGHATVGPTLHRIDPPIDTGRIYDVLATPLPTGMTYRTLRAFNQSLSLQLLDRLCGWLAEADGLAALERRLDAQAGRVTHRWGAYYSRKTVAALREAHAERLIDAPATAPQPAD